MARGGPMMKALILWELTGNVETNYVSDGTRCGLPDTSQNQEPRAMCACGHTLVYLFELFAETIDLLLEIGNFLLQARYFVFQRLQSLVAFMRMTGGMDGWRRRSRDPEVLSVAAEQMDVARLFGSGLARQNSCQRGFTLHQALQGQIGRASCRERGYERM